MTDHTTTPEERVVGDAASAILDVLAERGIVPAVGLNALIWSAIVVAQNCDLTLTQLTTEIGVLWAVAVAERSRAKGPMS